MKKRVLLLEDDENLAHSLCCEFQDHGYEVLHAKKVSDLLLHDKKHLDYAVLDMRLADGELGVHAISPILQAHPKCRIVVLSGYGSITSAVEAVKKGAVDYLTKPASFSQIEAALLGKRTQPEPDFQALSLAQVEHEYIDFVLHKNEGNITQTAKDLGLHRQSLQRKLKKYT